MHSETDIGRFSLPDASNINSLLRHKLQWKSVTCPVRKTQAWDANYCDRWSRSVGVCQSVMPVTRASVHTHSSEGATMLPLLRYCSHLLISRLHFTEIRRCGPYVRKQEAQLSLTNRLTLVHADVAVLLTAVSHKWLRFTDRIFRHFSISPIWHSQWGGFPRAVGFIIDTWSLIVMVLLDTVVIIARFRRDSIDFIIVN